MSTQMLKIRTKEVLYEKFRTEKLLARRATRNISEDETRRLLEGASCRVALCACSRLSKSNKHSVFVVQISACDRWVYLSIYLSGLAFASIYLLYLLTSFSLLLFLRLHLHLRQHPRPLTYPSHRQSREAPPHANGGDLSTLLGLCTSPSPLSLLCAIYYTYQQYLARSESASRPLLTLSALLCTHVCSLERLSAHIHILTYLLLSVSLSHMFFTSLRLRPELAADPF